ncbi:MAG: lysophospholipid acyltransferase family protein [Pseudomonadota bacterium]
MTVSDPPNAPASQTEAPDMSPAFSLRDVQFRLEYALLRLIIGTVRLFPLETAASLSASAWVRLAPRIAKKRHNRAHANVAMAFPEMDAAERRRIVDAHWRNLGRVMAETMQIDRLIKDPERITIRNANMFLRYRDKLGAAVGISLHMGNWELAIWPLTYAGANPAAIYRSVNNPYVDTYLRDQRKDLYPGGLFGRGRVDGDHGDDQKTARAITAFVRDGGRLGMVCDLYDRKGIPVPFFGHDARTQAIGAMIARRTGARIWLARCVRLGEASRFEIDLVELHVPRTGNMSEDVRTAMVGMQQQFEEWIREHPEQWMWSNRRWS